MNLDEPPQAVETLYRKVVGFQPVTIVMEEILAEFDVTEAAVRARFERSYGIMPE